MTEPNVKIPEGDPRHCSLCKARAEAAEKKKAKEIETDKAIDNQP